MDLQRHLNDLAHRDRVDISGDAKVDTPLNVYTQVIDGAKVAAARLIGNELNGIRKGLEP